jgi:hypothetical protein
MLRVRAVATSYRNNDHEAESSDDNEDELDAEAQRFIRMSKKTDNMATRPLTLLKYCRHVKEMGKWLAEHFDAYKDSGPILDNDQRILWVPKMRHYKAFKEYKRTTPSKRKVKGKYRPPKISSIQGYDSAMHHMQTFRCAPSALNMR